MLRIERAAHALATALQHMRIEHGGPDVFVPQEFLHGANVIAIFQQMGSKTVALMPPAALAAYSRVPINAA